jgi:hypothetical protein
MEWEFYCHLLCSRSRFTTTVEMNSTNDSWIDAINLHDKHYTTMLRQHKGYVIWPSGEPQLTQWFIFISFKKFSTTLKSWIWVENENFYFWDWVRGKQKHKTTWFQLQKLLGTFAYEFMSLHVSFRVSEGSRKFPKHWTKIHSCEYHELLLNEHLLSSFFILHLKLCEEHKGMRNNKIIICQHWIYGVVGLGTVSHKSIIVFAKMYEISFRLFFIWFVQIPNFQARWNVVDRPFFNRSPFFVHTQMKK